MPVAGSVSMRRLCRASPSASAKVNSAAVKLWAVSSCVETVSPLEVGASFSAVTLTVAVAVAPKAVPSERLKVKLTSPVAFAAGV